MTSEENRIEDYRVYVDPERSRIVLVFRAGDAQMSVSTNERDTERLIDALQRAVQELRARKSKH